SSLDDRPNPDRDLRRQLEAFHARKDPKAVATAWPHLDSPDRYIRSAARVAIEHQDPATWGLKALTETKPEAAIQALLALVRVKAPDPFHRKPSDPPADPQLRRQIVQALGRIDWEKLSDSQRLDLLRLYAVLFNRLGWPDRTERDQVIKRLDPHFPA